MDTSMESFFYQRAYTERNFCFFLQILSAQGKMNEALKAFRLMESMKIRPTDHTYNQLMMVFAKNRDLEMVEKLNQEALDKYGLKPSSHRYNAIITCLAKMNNASDAEKVLREMKELGLKADTVTYTTIIDAYKRVNKLNKCWELFNEARLNMDIGADEMLISYMIRLAGKTHESEKALRLFAELESDGFHQQAKFYNSIISALASTKRYAETAIEYWQKM